MLDVIVFVSEGRCHNRVLLFLFLLSEFRDVIIFLSFGGVVWILMGLVLLWWGSLVHDGLDKVSLESHIVIQVLANGHLTTEGVLV